MSLAAHLSRAPRAYDPERGAEALSSLPALPGELAELIRGTAGSSPYLGGLITREAEWLEGALTRPPGEVRDAILAEAGAADEGDLSLALRRAKRRMALWAALCDLGGAWPLEQVTAALTDLADLATHRALMAEVGAEIRRGRLPGLDRHAAPERAGIVALAMGKMGAHELNYSSDIDLICLFDEGCFDPGEVMEARASLVKAVRRAMALLSDTSAEGYVFRTDLRLRPDPSVTPVCLGTEYALRYYESLGRSWERAAHIKARPCAGAIGVGEAYLSDLTPFVWRKHLDFAAIEDAHAMRLRIREHKGTGGDTLEDRDLKLGRGGIREIEFFTQTRQIIAGGRDPDLRLRGTVESLRALAGAGWVPEGTAEQLIADYRAHREVEHRLQMIADRQTHQLPDSAEGWDRLAALMGCDLQALKSELAGRVARVAELTEAFFAPEPRTAPAADMPDLTQTQAEIVEKWRGYPALRSPRALDIFDRIKPQFLRHLLTGARPDQALLHFDGFLRGLPAGVQLFSLFESNPQLISLIADIADTAPDLSAYLSRNAGVLDSVLGGDFFADWPGAETLEADLASELARARDYEDRLDTARRWCKDWRFRIGVHHLRGIAEAAEAGRRYADLAQAVLRALWPAVVDEFAAKHGPPPGAGAMVLGMGSLGAGSLNAKSDLDLIVIYDDAGVEASEGRRPLAARVYYARLTQALVTALSAPTAEGRLYEVDMRLRPSGKQGPVATARQSFERYQREEAWAWEHLALTRARPVAGEPELGERVERFRRELLAGISDPARVLGETARMRTRLAEARPGQPWAMKPGRGRLQEIELAASALALLAGAGERDPDGQIAAGAGAGVIGWQQAETLRHAYRVIADVHMAAKLLSDDVVDPAALGAGGEAMLLRGSGAETPEALSALITHHAEAAGAVIDELLAPYLDRAQGDASALGSGGGAG